MELNKFIIGDTLDVLKSIPDESIDLIFLNPFELLIDPLDPFDRRRDEYDQELKSFIIQWKSDINIYISWLEERTLEMKRVLRKTGSFYFYCNRRYIVNNLNIDHYIKANVLDKIFGWNNFRSEIIFQLERNNSSIFEKIKNVIKATMIQFFSIQKVIIIRLIPMKPIIT
jgi:hypothetical protein